MTTNEYMSIAGIRSRDHIINLDAYWRDVRIEYSSGDPIYIGRHFLNDADTSATNWAIWKYTYDGLDVTRIELLEGSWDNRASLGWGV